MFVEKWEDFTDNVKKLTANTDPDRMRTVFNQNFRKLRKNNLLILLEKCTPSASFDRTIIISCSTAS